MGNIILTSDDFGLSKIYNREIISAIVSNLLSSVSIMVEGQIVNQQQQVGELLNLTEQQKISLGLHLEINDHEIIEELCNRQWTSFLAIIGREPDYVDIHKDHLFPHLYDAIANFCIERNVAFRKYKETTVPVNTPDDMYMASSKSLIDLSNRLNDINDNETLELVFHIGVYDENVKSSLNKERSEDRIKLEEAHQMIQKLGLNIVSYHHLNPKLTSLL